MVKVVSTYKDYIIATHWFMTYDDAKAYATRLMQLYPVTTAITFP